MKTLHLTIILLFIFLLIPYTSLAYSQVTNSTVCQNKILSADVNQTKAILFAVNSSQFKSVVNGSEVNFDYVYYKSNLTCGELKSVNVLFHVKLSTSIATLVIVEDPDLTKIVDVVKVPVSCEGACYGFGPCTCFTGIPLQKELTTLEAPIPVFHSPAPFTEAISKSDITLHQQESNLIILWISIPVALAVGISVIFLRQKFSKKIERNGRF